MGTKRFEIREVESSLLRSAVRGSSVACSFLLVCLLLEVSKPSHAQAPIGQSATPANSVPKAQSVDSVKSAQLQTPDYIIAPEDQLEIYFFEVPEISRTYRVSPTGLITMPLLPDPVVGAGLTPSQLSQLIATKYREAGLLQNPQVTISVKDTKLHSVVIAGAVQRPQVYPIFGPTRLLDMITQAGGLAPDAGNTALVTRGRIAMRMAASPSGSEPDARQNAMAPKVSVDVRKLLETGDESLNLPIYAGDRITVPPAGIFYVIGAVARPGGYPLKDVGEEMTALKLLALAGDVSSAAKKNKILILRKNPQSPDQREAVDLDLKKILARRAPDPRLQEDDIIFVPENGKVKAIRSAMGTGIGIGSAVTTGLIIYRR